MKIALIIIGGYFGVGVLLAIGFICYVLLNPDNEPRDRTLINRAPLIIPFWPIILWVYIKASRQW